LIHPTTPASQPPLMSATRATLVGAVLIALGPISLALYTPAMPTLAVAFGSTLAAVKLTMSLYFAGFSLSQLACGPLSDAFGRRPVNLAFMSLYLAASLLAAFAPTIEVLMVARLLQGVGAAAGVAIARAIVRDLFTGQESAKVMNAIGIFLAIGPAVSPTLGGLLLQIFGWRSIFDVMVIYGLAVMAMVVFILPETNRTPDRASAHPRGLVRSYGELLGQLRFMAPAITLGATVGCLYMLSTILPFVLIDRVGLTPTAFGYSMMIQTLSYLTGGLVVQRLLRVTDAGRLVAPGIGLCLVAAGLLIADLNLFAPTVFNVMGPIGIFAFGIAFVTPSLSTAALAPFPHMAGAAAALLGFCQMGGGLIGSIVSALMPDAVVALTIVLPAMALIAVVAHTIGRTARA
jgi:MFS transporter, DHA1 family, multidrug resistance protein